MPNNTVGAVDPNQNNIINYPGGGNYDGIVTATAPASDAALTHYPTPVVNALMYKLPVGLKSHRLTVTDTAGRQVLSKSFGRSGEENAIDLSALKPGLYMVRLTGEGFDSQFKISKQ